MRTYTVRISIPQGERPVDARDRISLLTTIMMKLVEGAPQWKAVDVDFDACVAVLEVRAPRFRGLRSGRAVIDVIEKHEDEGGTGT